MAKYRRLSSIDPALVRAEAANIRATGEPVSRRRLARGLGSRNSGDKIDQQLCRAVMGDPELVPELTEALAQRSRRPRIFTIGPTRAPDLLV